MQIAHPPPQVRNQLLMAGQRCSGFARTRLCRFAPPLNRRARPAADSGVRRFLPRSALGKVM